MTPLDVPNFVWMAFRALLCLFPFCCTDAPGKEQGKKCMKCDSNKCTKVSYTLGCPKSRKWGEE